MRKLARTSQEVEKRKRVEKWERVAEKTRQRERKERAEAMAGDVGEYVPSDMDDEDNPSGRFGFQDDYEDDREDEEEKEIKKDIVIPLFKSDEIDEEEDGTTELGADTQGIRLNSKSMVVRKSNNFIEAVYRMPEKEGYSLTGTNYKLLLYMLTRIYKDDKEFSTYEISAKEFRKLLGANRTDFAHKEIIKSLESLMVVRLNMKDANSAISIITGYYKGRGTDVIKFRFNQDMRMYLLQLKDKFTSYNIKNLMPMGKHCFRIYELLKSHAWKNNSLKISISELYTILGVSYNSFTHFKKLLDPALKQIRKRSDIRCRCKAIKTGRKVTDLSFTIKKKRKRIEKAKKKDSPQVPKKKKVDEDKHPSLTKKVAEAMQRFAGHRKLTSQQLDMNPKGAERIFNLWEEKYKDKKDFNYHAKTHVIQFFNGFVLPWLEKEANKKRGVDGRWLLSEYFEDNLNEFIEKDHD